MGRPPEAMLAAEDLTHDHTPANRRSPTFEAGKRTPPTMGLVNSVKKSWVSEATPTPSGRRVNDDAK
jgi:hypothetical protein